MKRFEFILTAMMTVAAIIIAAAVVKRVFMADEVSPRASANASSPLENPAHWDEMLSLGQLISDSGGPRKMVVLADFECPACRSFHRTMRDIEERFPGAFEIRMIHMPLPYHRFAAPSARLAECSVREGRFSQVADVLFSAQDSLGLLPWDEIARRAGIANSNEVAACASEKADSERFSRIDRGLKLANDIGANATPTVIIDQQMYRSIPSMTELERLASEIRQNDP